MAATPRDGLLSPHRRALTVGLVLTVTLVAFEALAISTVMPLVVRDLGGIELYGWVFSAFFLGSLIGIVIVGGLLDQGGLVRPLGLGLGLFAIGLVIGGLAPSMPVLVAARALQGLGAGAIPPTVYVAIGRSLPEALRPRMFAFLSTAWVIPGVIGPAIAGIVGETAGWRWVFLGLLPILAVSGLVTARALRHVAPAPEAEHVAAAATRRRLPLALTVATGAGLLLAGLTTGEPLLLVGLVVVGAIIATPAFLRLTPPGTLRLAAGLPAAIGLRGVLTLAFFAADAYVALLLIDYRGTSAVEAGIALTSATLAWTAGAWIQARRVEAWGVARFVGVGFLTVAAGIATTMIVLVPEVPWPLAVPTWGIAGLGMGLSYAPLSLFTLREAPPAEQGGATSALQLSDTLGVALGTGIGGAFIAAGERTGAEPWVGLAATFGLGAVVGVLGALASPRLRRSRRPSAPAEAAAPTGPGASEPAPPG
jgi:MFS family permease